MVAKDKDLLRHRVRDTIRCTVLRLFEAYLEGWWGPSTGGHAP